MMAIVQGTVSTIRAASSMVIKRTASKLDLAQNQEVARYMDIMRICTKDADGKDVWQVSFPLKSDLLKQVREGLKQLEGNHVEAARHTLSEYLLQLTDESLFWYFEQPMALLHLGPILSRICKAGTETARKASRAVIQRVFTKLDARQMETVGGFLKELLVECEPRFPEQSAN
jgi:hypothetical protein